MHVKYIYELLKRTLGLRDHKQKQGLNSMFSI